MGVIRVHTETQGEADDARARADAGFVDDDHAAELLEKHMTRWSTLLARLK